MQVPSFFIFKTGTQRAATTWLILLFVICKSIPREKSQCVPSPCVHITSGLQQPVVAPKHLLYTRVHCEALEIESRSQFYAGV